MFTSFPGVDRCLIHYRHCPRQCHMVCKMLGPARSHPRSQRGSLRRELLLTPHDSGDVMPLYETGQAPLEVCEMSDAHALVRLPYPETILPPDTHPSLRTGDLLQRANDRAQCRGHIATHVSLPVQVQLAAPPRCAGMVRSRRRYLSLHTRQRILLLRCADLATDTLAATAHSLTCMRLRQ